jgi:hypothetical protein
VKTQTATATPVATAEAPVESNETPLKRICQELKIDPKTARRKLRAYWRKQDSDLAHTLRNRWSGDEAYAKQIRAILSPAKH